MQQQIQTALSPQQCLAEATAFFNRRRAKVSDRTEQGLRFALEGTGAEDGGQVTVAPSAGGGSTVTVEADGLGVLAIAEGFVRELRKQARGAGRQDRATSNAGASSGFADLRQRLGMPEPPPERPASPPPARPAGSTPPTPPPARRPAPPPGAPAQPGLSAPPGPSDGAPPAAPAAGEALGPEAAATPSPPGAGAAPPPQPRDADPADAAVAVAAASEEVAAGPGAEGRLPSRELATSAGDAAATVPERPGHQALSTEAPSAEQIGGVPRPEQVQVTGEAPPEGAPGRPTPGPGPGERSGPQAPPAS